MHARSDGWLLFLLCCGTNTISFEEIATLAFSVEKLSIEYSFSYVDDILCISVRVGLGRIPADYTTTTGSYIKRPNFSF